MAAVAVTKKVRIPFYTKGQKITIDFLKNYEHYFYVFSPFDWLFQPLDAHNSGNRISPERQSFSAMAMNRWAMLVGAIPFLWITDNVRRKLGCFGTKYNISVSPSGTDAITESVVSTAPNPARII